MLEKVLKNQGLALTGAVVFLLWLCYHFAFNRTWDAWQLNQQLKKQMQTAGDVSRQPGYLRRKDSNLKKQLKAYQADTLLFRSAKVNQIAAIAESNHAKLSEVPPDDPGYHISQLILQRLDFEGDFFALTRTLNQLEHTPGIGEIRSLTYRSVKDPVQQQKKRLVLEIYFEYLK